MYPTDVLTIILSLLIVAIIIGSFVLWIINSARKERLEKEQLKRVLAEAEERKRMAQEMQGKARRVARTCNSNLKDLNLLYKTSYTSQECFLQILENLSDLTELQGRLRAIEESFEKGGVQR